MQAMTSTFFDAIRGPQMLATEATVYSPDGSDSLVLDVNDGTVTIDRTADHRRELELVIAEPVYPATTSDILGVYGSEIVVKRGVRYGGESTELAQLGVFRIQDISRSVPDHTITLTGWDRSMQVADQRFLGPRKFAATQATTLISQLITEVYPDAVIHVDTTDTTVIKKHHVDRDRWEEILRIARVIGCEVFVDAMGEWVIQDIPDPASAVAVWQVDAGPGGVLVGTRDEVSREGVPSIVRVRGEPVSGGTHGGDPDPPVTSALPHGYDDNPLSPTYYLGPYGKVPRFFSSQHIRTVAQANKVADKMLANHLGATRTISFDAIPNPALDAGDAVEVVYPDGSRETHLIDALTIPLGTEGVMTGETRARDWAAE